MTFEDAVVVIFLAAAGGLALITAPVWMPVVAAAVATIAAVAGTMAAAAGTVVVGAAAAAGTLATGAAATAGTLATGAAAAASTLATGVMAVAASEPGRKLMGMAAPTVFGFLGHAVAGEGGEAAGQLAGELVAEML